MPIPYQNNNNYVNRAYILIAKNDIFLAHVYFTIVISNIIFHSKFANTLQEEHPVFLKAKKLHNAIEKAVDN